MLISVCFMCTPGAHRGQTRGLVASPENEVMNDCIQSVSVLARKLSSSTRAVMPLSVEPCLQPQISQLIFALSLSPTCSCP